MYIYIYMFMLPRSSPTCYSRMPIPSLFACGWRLMSSQRSEGFGLFPNVYRSSFYDGEREPRRTSKILVFIQICFYCVYIYIYTFIIVIINIILLLLLLLLILLLLLLYVIYYLCMCVCVCVHLQLYTVSLKKRKNRSPFLIPLVDLSADHPHDRIQNDRKLL